MAGGPPRIVHTQPLIGAARETTKTTHPEGQLAIHDLSDQKKLAGGKWLCGKVAKKVPDQFQYELRLFAMWSMPNL
jgi:hypothetical protein